MKHTIRISLYLVMLITSLTGCKKFLDINSDPDTPQQPDASSVMPAMLAAIPRGIQFDARYIGRYVQNYVSATSTAAGDVWDVHGYQPASDVSGDIWRQTYFGLGANLDYMIREGQKRAQWDYVGAALALKAYMFQNATDVHGDIIYTEAFKENTSAFKYDPQEVVYRGVDSLCKLALFYLSKNDITTAYAPLSKGDYVYGGDRTKWTKFANGILARNFMRYSNKADFNTKYADSVLYYADRSFKSISDDFLIPFDATKNDDTNFFGPYRNNMGGFRQSNFVVMLLDGRTLAGSQTFANRDPRIKHMLSTSTDTTNGNGGYRGLNAGTAEPNTGNTRTSLLWGDSTYANPSGASVFNPSKGKFLFRDKAVAPIMTYSEIQFLMAEAAFRKNDKPAAYTAYRNGILAHFDFINRATFPRSNVQLYNGTPISTAERNAYMASANVKQNFTSLTLTDIMLQKYISQWGWNFVEQWVDLRRYHYNDIDPATGLPIFNGYVIPATLPATNNGKLVYRIRPRYNSEYVWNVPELERIGATDPAYHTVPMWFSIP